jgi:hypothetical protein
MIDNFDSGWQTAYSGWVTSIIALVSSMSWCVYQGFAWYFKSKGQLTSIKSQLDEINLKIKVLEAKSETQNDTSIEIKTNLMHIKESLSKIDNFIEKFTVVKVK